MSNLAISASGPAVLPSLQGRLFNIYCWLQLSAAVKTGGCLPWLTFHHCLLCLQVLRGAQLIAVASADSGAAAVEGSSLPPDIQVQYVQLAPVTDHTAAVQVRCRSHMPPINELLPGTYTNRLHVSIPRASVYSFHLRRNRPWHKFESGAPHTHIKVSADPWDLVSHLCSSALCLCRPVISQSYCQSCSMHRGRWCQTVLWHLRCGGRTKLKV